MITTVAPPRRAVVVLAVLFVLLVTGSGAVALTSEWFRSTTEHNTVLHTRVERLTVYNSSGDVRLSPSVDDAVHVHTQAQFGLQAPALIEESTSNGAMLQAHCDDGPLDCAVDYTIEVPPDFVVEVQAMAGVVTARALTGQVALEVGSGRVDLFDMSGPVSVRAHDADISALGLTSNTVTVSNVSGDVSLDLLSAPSSIQAHTIIGNLDIAVPAEQAPYRVSADSGRGLERVGVGTGQTSAHAITATTEYGIVRIRPTGTDPEQYPVRVPSPLVPDKVDAPVRPELPELPEPPEPLLPN